MVGRAGGGAEREDFFLEKLDHPVMGQKCRRALIKEGLVGGTAALGDEQEFVGVVAFLIDVDLGRQIVFGVLLLEHRQRGELRVTQILALVRVKHALAERVGVAAFRPHAPALLGHDDRGAGVLAHGQHAAGGDVGVLQQIVGDEAVIVGRLGVVENGRELFQMAGPQQMIDVRKRRFGQKPQRLRFHRQNIRTPKPVDRDEIAGQLAIGRCIWREGKHLGFGRFGHWQYRLRGGCWRRFRPGAANVQR